MLNLLVITIIISLIPLLLMILNFIISKKKITDREKASPFECGFDPFTSPRLPFSIQFYLISIIFLIFDIEIILFLPFIPSYLYNKYTVWSETTLIFILILLIGLYMEWKNGALTWMK